eukprot:TRINITY_DN40009_c0_g1_i1.p1 TRINITY_DN40009_c0_g1~~TRINITY_DN40009_c0_g1_i1.p1  ORF type:complete len:162 (+),score=44.65 TRINITY_DN40009_c0_g1_i1:82-567(+)
MAYRSVLAAVGLAIVAAGAEKKPTIVDSCPADAPAPGTDCMLMVTFKDGQSDSETIQRLIHEHHDPAQESHAMPSLRMAAMLYGRDTERCCDQFAAVSQNKAVELVEIGSVPMGTGGGSDADDVMWLFNAWDMRKVFKGRSMLKGDVKEVVMGDVEELDLV